MASITSVSFTANFEMENATPQLTLTDTTDYATQGIVLGDGPAGVIKLEGPSGVVYNNTDYGAADIPLPLSAPNSTITIPLPLDSGGNLLQGTYTVTYSVKLVSGDGSEATLATEKAISYTKPSADVVMTYSASTPLLTSDDRTDYTVDLITPSIVRDHDIFYPASLSIPRIDGTAKIVTTGTIYTVADTTLAYTSTLVADTTYDYGDGITLTDEVTGNGQIDITTGATICQVYCCLNHAFDRYLTLSTTNTIEAKKALTQLEEATSIAFLIFAANTCGKTDDVTAYANRLRSVLNCTDSCDCGDEPQIVVGSGGAGSTSVVEAGTGITVTSVTGGSTTTYTVAVSSSTLNNITTNASNIALNSIKIAANTADIATNVSAISALAVNINNNAIAIAANVTNIGNNTTNINANTTNIATNTADIATNVSAISANASNISTNTTNITNNASAISTNTANIATNTADIATNASAISNNATNISTNTTNIAANASNIAALQVEAWEIVSTYVSIWNNNPDAALSELQYRKDPYGMVHLQGGVTNSGTPASNTIFVLPSGYRPTLSFYANVYDSSGGAEDSWGVEIDNTGNVILQGTLQANMQLNFSLSFIAA